MNLPFRVTMRPMINERIVFRDGRRRLKIHLLLYVDDVMASFDQAQKRLAKAEEIYSRTGNSAAAEEYSDAAVALIEAVFGQDAAAAIFAFYDNRPIQLLNDVYGFIRERIVPQLRDPLARVGKKR